MEAPFKTEMKFDICLVWWCSNGPLNSKEYKSLKFIVTIKISMIEYDDWSNSQAHLYSNIAVYGDKCVR